MVYESPLRSPVRQRGGGRHGSGPRVVVSLPDEMPPTPTRVGLGGVPSPLAAMKRLEADIIATQVHPLQQRVRELGEALAKEGTRRQALEAAAAKHADELADTQSEVKRQRLTDYIMLKKKDDRIRQLEAHLEAVSPGTLGSDAGAGGNASYPLAHSGDVSQQTMGQTPDASRSYVGGGGAGMNNQSFVGCGYLSVPGQSDATMTLRTANTSGFTAGQRSRMGGVMGSGDVSLGMSFPMANHSAAGELDAQAAACAAVGGAGGGDAGDASVATLGGGRGGSVRSGTPGNPTCAGGSDAACPPHLTFDEFAAELRQRGVLNRRRASAASDDGDAGDASASASAPSWSHSHAEGNPQSAFATFIAGLEKTWPQYDPGDEERSYTFFTDKLGALLQVLRETEDARDAAAERVETLEALAGSLNAHLNAMQAELDAQQAKADREATAIIGEFTQHVDAERVLKDEALAALREALESEHEAAVQMLRTSASQWEGRYASAADEAKGLAQSLDVARRDNSILEEQLDTLRGSIRDIAGLGVDVDDAAGGDDGGDKEVITHLVERCKNLEEMTELLKRELAAAKEDAGVHKEAVEKVADEWRKRVAAGEDDREQLQKRAKETEKMIEHYKGMLETAKEQMASMSSDGGGVRGQTLVQQQGTSSDANRSSQFLQPGGVGSGGGGPRGRFMRGATAEELDMFMARERGFVPVESGEEVNRELNVTPTSDLFRADRPRGGEEGVESADASGMLMKHVGTIPLGQVAAEIASENSGAAAAAAPQASGTLATRQPSGPAPVHTAEETEAKVAAAVDAANATAAKAREEASIAWQLQTDDERRRADNAERVADRLRMEATRLRKDVADLRAALREQAELFEEVERRVVDEAMRHDDTTRQHEAQHAEDRAHLAAQRHAHDALAAESAAKDRALAGVEGAVDELKDALAAERTAAGEAREMLTSVEAARDKMKGDITGYLAALGDAEQRAGFENQRCALLEAENRALLVKLNLLETELASRPSSVIPPVLNHPVRAAALAAAAMRTTSPVRQQSPGPAVTAGAIRSSYGTLHGQRQG